MFFSGSTGLSFLFSVEIILEAKDQSLVFVTFSLECMLHSLYDISSSSAVEFDFRMEDRSLYSL